MEKFQLVTDFVPRGDQPRAIDELTRGVLDSARTQVLLGVTGSGKTFTMANVIAGVNRPTLILAHNKTLAAQLFNEFRQLFPHSLQGPLEKKTGNSWSSVQTCFFGLIFSDA